MNAHSDAQKNKHRYTSSRLYHIISSLPYAFISLFARRDPKLIVFCAMHCETFDSNSKFLFLHFLNNEPDYTVKFVINNDELRNSLTAKYGNHFIDTRTKEGKKLAVKARTWVVSWLDLPLGGLFLNFRRFVLHLGHGTPLKNIGLLEGDGKLIKKIYYRLNNTNITFSLGSSPFIADIISKCFGLSKKRVIVNGQPRTDALFLPPANLPILKSNSFNILYAPTWRQHSEVSLFPFKDFDASALEHYLIENNITLYIRFHPAYEETIPKDILSLENVILFSARDYTEVMDYINCFDALITDYSSIYLDFMLLERPIVFLPYDLDEYQKSVGFTMEYMDNTPGEKPSSFKAFLDELNIIKNTPEERISRIHSLNQKLNSSSKDNCSNLAKVIKER